MEGTQKKLFAPNLICIGVDGRENGDLYGRIWEPYNVQPQEFMGINDLIVQLDEMYDRWDYPQRATNHRSFIKGNIASESVNIRKIDFKDKTDRIQSMRGKRATFSVKVMYRQHATWQGQMIWVEGNELESFQSAWEMIRQMDNAMCETEIDV